MILRKETETSADKFGFYSFSKVQIRMNDTP